MAEIQNKLTSQNGFTLLEIMISMFIFAVGMLGLTSIQSHSLGNSHSSYARNQAILLAYEMVDRMKSNPTADNYAITTTNTATTEPEKLCDETACTRNEMATYDHWQWKAALPDLLLSGVGQVVNTSVAINSYTITVYWDGDRSGATGTTCPPASATDLRCFQLSTQL